MRAPRWSYTDGPLEAGLRSSIFVALKMATSGSIFAVPAASFTIMTDCRPFSSFALLTHQSIMREPEWTAPPTFSLRARPTMDDLSLEPCPTATNGTDTYTASNPIFAHFSTQPDHPCRAQP